MEAFVTKVANYLVSQSWQVPVVFVLVAAACWGLRKHSAHWRYLLWLIVLAKCLVPGMIGVPIAVLPQKDKTLSTPAVSNPSQNTISSRALKPASVTANTAEPEMASDNSRPVLSAPKPASPHIAVSSDLPTAEKKPGIKLTMRDGLVLAWFTGMVLFLTYLSIRAWTIHRQLNRYRQTIAPEMQAKVTALAKQLKLKVLPTVYMTDGIAQPFVWGWFRGSIYLPMQFLDAATPEQQQAILTHELAHIARWDAAMNLLQIMVQAVFFFHPLIWWTNRQIRREREKCCDEFVLASLVANPKQYSQAIVNALVAEYESNQPIPSLAIAGRLKNIEERIQTILNPQGRFYRRPSWVAVATVACLTACAIPTALVLTARGGSADPQPVSASQSTPPSLSKTDAVAETKEKPAAPVADTKKWLPGQTLDFRVINAKTKEPLPDVKLELQFSGKGINFQYVKVQTTNAQGRSEIRLPDLKPDAVRVYPSKAGFVPLRVFWGSDNEPQSPPVIPTTVTVPMEPGTVWGGVVKNEKGEPIPNVKVCVHYWSKGKEFNPHLRVNICVEDSVVTTDKDGRWRIDIMPEKFGEEGPFIFLTHPDYVSDHLQRGITPMPVTERPSYKSLQDQTAVMVMSKGATIAGRVTDESGKPISGALICNQYDAYYPDSLKITATTDNEGRFRLSGLSHRQNYRNYFFTVQAAGHSPVFVEVSDDDAGTPADIKLKPGQPVQGQVVDENGKPLEGVSIKLDYWMGRPRQFYLRTTTDANGKFRIDDAPPKQTEYDFEKQGYIAVRKPLPPKAEDYRIELRPPIWIEGSIVDAETNKPLAKCSLTKGHEYDGGAAQWETEIGMPAKTITDGRYELEITQEQWPLRIRVEADGYMPAVSRLFKPYNPDRGRVTYDIKLTKAVPMTGTVLGLDGKPLAGAEVFVAKQQFFAKNHKAEPKVPRGSRMAKTGANGRFEFPPETEPFYLIALHEQGHMVLDEKQFALTPTFSIGPWRAPDQFILIDRKHQHQMPDADDAKQTLAVRVVDSEGKPIEGAIVANFASFNATYNYLGSNEGAWTYYRDAVSDANGMARISDQNRIDCVVARHVERKLVAVQSVSQEQVDTKETLTLTMQPQCEVFGKLTAKELEAHNRKLLWSNVYVYMENGNARPMSCSSGKADFHFYLPPGTYKLNAYAGDTRDADKTITVKAGQTELEVEPIDLPPTGLVLLEGKPAPELRDVIAWKNGGPVKLSDLKGKVVILVFTSRWIDPHSMMKEMFPVYEKYKDQGLVVIEIRFEMGYKFHSEAQLEEKLAEVKKPFWMTRDLPIPIALVVENRLSFPRNAEEKNANANGLCPIMEDYGVHGIPSGVLIDRQGRIVGRFDPRGKSDDALLEKVIKEK